LHRLGYVITRLVKPPSEQAAAAGGEETPRAVLEENEPLIIGLRAAAERRKLTDGVVNLASAKPTEASMPSKDLNSPKITLVARPLLYAIRLARRLNSRIRGLWLKLQLKAAGASVGKRLSADRGVRLTTSCGARWNIGDRVSFGAGVILSVGKEASLTIGDDVVIMHYTMIGAEHSISIGDRAQVAEHCSIRDHDHDVSQSSMHGAAVVCSAVSIGEDAWIGRGVAVLKGSQVGAGAVIGANAVARGEIPQDAIAVGIPARVIRMRR
jgi:acetyltransferase-like isoleucine patch superfamily enzyme